MKVLPIAEAYEQKLEALRAPEPRKARFVGFDAKGKKLYRFTVIVKFNNSAGTVQDWVNPPSTGFEVLSHSVKDAADWARDEYRLIPEASIYCYGPKGGLERRFVSWESSIYSAMMEPKNKTLSLF